LIAENCSATLQIFWVEFLEYWQVGNLLFSLISIVFCCLVQPAQEHVSGLKIVEGGSGTVGVICDLLYEAIGIF